MSTLRKPASCDCNSINLKFNKSPERWNCLDCGKIVAARRCFKDLQNKCRNCNGPRIIKELTPYERRFGFLCKKCVRAKRRSISKRWRRKSLKNIRLFRATQRRNVQKTPERFIRNLVTVKLRLQRYGTKKGKSKRRRWALKTEINFDSIWALWKKQRGRCAISKMQMTHEFKNPRTISIDRIDSHKGYVKGNLQLVCQWVNYAKCQFLDSEIRKVLAEFKST